MYCCFTSFAYHVYCVEGMAIVDCEKEDANGIFHVVSLSFQLSKGTEDSSGNRLEKMENG